MIGMLGTKKGVSFIKELVEILPPADLEPIPDSSVATSSSDTLPEKKRKTDHPFFEYMAREAEGVAAPPRRQPANVYPKR